jgi:crossover junction endodeoxyribonuclease RuvC
MPTIVGIDPGLHGGIAWTAEEGRLMCAIPMPIMPKGNDKHDLDLYEIVRWIKGLGKIDLAVVERATAMPKQGVVSMFTFGKGYGMLLGMLAALDVRVEDAPPITWKKIILANTAKDKDAAIFRTLNLYPHLRESVWYDKKKKFPDGVADAVCLVDYGIHRYNQFTLKETDDGSCSTPVEDPGR